MLKSGEIYFHGTDRYPFKMPFKGNGLIWFTQDLSYATDFIYSTSDYDKKLSLVVVAKVKFKHVLKVGNTEIPLLRNNALSKKTKAICDRLNIPEKEIIDLYNTIKIDIEPIRPVWISDILNKPLMRDYLKKNGFDSVIALESNYYTLGIVDSSQAEFIKQGVSEDEASELLFEDKASNNNEALVEKKKRKKNHQVNTCAGNVEKNVDFFNLVMSGDTSNDSSLFVSDGSFVGGESLSTEDYIKQSNDLYEQEHELKETSYNRVLKHINSGEFVIISPYREEYSEKENKARMRELQSIVRKNLKLGYIWLKSTWNSFNEKGEPNTIEEESLLVPNMTLKQGIDLGVKYKQFSIIVKDEDGLREICTTPYDSNFKVGDVVQSFSYGDRDSLGLDEVRNILQHKKEGSISTSKKGKVSFSLKKLEKLNRPAFSSFDDRVLTTELYSSDEQELKEANKTSKALFGDYSNKIKTFGIVSAENPNGKELSSNENVRRTNQLKQRLKTMVLQFKKLYGVYKENKERSFIIFNCSLNEMKELAKDFGQESFFFGTTKMIDNNSDERKTSSSISYYQRDDENSPYELIETSDDIITDIDFNDFYSKHRGLNFKIDMDFFKEELESLKTPYSEELLEKTTNDDNYIGYVPQKRWRDRISTYRVRGDK